MPPERDAALYAPLIAEYAKKGASPPLPSEEQLRRHRAYREEFASPRETHVAIGGRDYCIEVPPHGFFLDRLRNDQPFAFARLTHGHWDALALRDRIAAEPRLAALGAAERLAVAAEIARAAKPFDGSFVEDFLDEMSVLMRRHRDDERFFNAVAFKGYPTPDEELFAPETGPDERADRLARLAQFFRPDERLIDANLWKRLAYSGELLGILPQLCADRHVVLAGRDYFGDLDRRWRLRRFTHVVIPRRLAHRSRSELLEQLTSILSTVAGEGGPRPVVITQCGAVAYWLTAHLFARYPDVFYIDLGQALDIWFTDLKDIGAAMWMRYYAATR